MMNNNIHKRAVYKQEPVDVKRQRVIKKTFGNLFLLKRSRFLAVWDAQKSLEQLKKDLEEIRIAALAVKTNILDKELLTPLNITATLLMKANKAGHAEEKDKHITELVRIMKKAVEQEKTLASKIIEFKSNAEQHNRDMLNKQRVFRVCLYAIREAAVIINKSNFSHEYDAYKKDKKAKYYQQQQQDADAEQAPETDLLPEELINFMSIENIARHFDMEAKNNIGTATVSVNTNSDSFTHNKADADFIRRININKMTADDKARGVKIFNECRRHIKTMIDMCDAVDKRLAQIYDDHDTFVASFRDFIKC